MRDWWASRSATTSPSDTPSQLFANVAPCAYAGPMPPKRGRPYASTVVRRAFFTMQVRPPGGHGQTLTLHVPQGEAAQPDRSPQAVDHLELIPALGLLCAIKKGQHTEYPVGQILQLELDELPIGTLEAEAAE